MTGDLARITKLPHPETLDTAGFIVAVRQELEKLLEA